MCLQLARTRVTAPRVQSASPSPEESAIVLALLDSTSTQMELAQTLTNACPPPELVGLEHFARTKLVRIAASVLSEPLVIHTLVCVPQTRPSALETTTVVLTRSVLNPASASALRPSSLTPKMEESVRVLAKGSCVA